MKKFVLVFGSLPLKDALYTFAPSVCKEDAVPATGPLSASRLSPETTGNYWAFKGTSLVLAKLDNGNGQDSTTFRFHLFVPTADKQMLLCDIDLSVLSLSRGHRRNFTDRVPCCSAWNSLLSDSLHAWSF